VPSKLFVVFFAKKKTCCCVVDHPGPGGRGCGCGKLVLGAWDDLTTDSLRLLAPAQRQTTCSEVEAAEVGEVVGVSSGLVRHVDILDSQRRVHGSLRCES
jgi:hypothetical protein